MSDNTIEKLKIDKTYAPAQARKKRWYPAAALVIAVAVLAAAWKFFSPAAEVTAVTVGSAYPSQGVAVLNASGYVVAQRKAAVASKTTGRIIAISVEEGDRVKKGDIIARLEAEDSAAAQARASANLKTANANLAVAQAEFSDAAALFRRHRELLDRGFIARLEYDATEARLRKAEASVHAAESAVKASAAALEETSIVLGYSVIRAPFDAVVLTKNADIGDIVTPIGAAANAKAAVVTIADMSSLQVEVDVSESNLSLVKSGQPCEIQLDALPDTRFRGRVHMIVPTADRTKASVMLKIRFLDTDPRILPEMSAKVAFLERDLDPAEMKPRTAVSADAVIARGDRKYVFRIAGGRVAEQEVATGSKIGDMVEVLSGLSAGDKVVLRPSPGLRTGTRIREQEVR